MRGETSSIAYNTVNDSRRAWVIVFAAFVGSFVSFGVAYSFGVFLAPLKAEFHSNHAVMSALFSTMSALSFLLAPITGGLADRFGPRPVVAAGAVFAGAGLVTAASVHSLPLLFTTYGIGVGLAVACTYIPAIATVGAWFKVRRDIALGVAISGIGCGTLVVAPVSGVLVARYGWRASFEILGWSSAVLLLISAVLLTRPPATAQPKKLNIGDRLRTRSFFLLYTSELFSGIAIYVSFVFLAPYATGIGATSLAAASLLGYVGAASTVGRLGLNALAPRFGLLTMYRISYAILLAGFGFWLTAHSYSSLILFALVMGTGYGGIAAMIPAVAASLFGTDNLGELLGVLFTGLGAACLVGPPLAGALVDYTHDYQSSVFVGAAASVLALAFVIPLHGPLFVEAPVALSPAVVPESDQPL